MPITIVQRTPLPVVPPIIVPIPETLKFEPMLAASEIPTIDKIKFPILASFKYDGIRSPITSGVAMSRKMLPLQNLHIQLWVQKYAEYLNGLDGEMIVGPGNLTAALGRELWGIRDQLVGKTLVSNFQKTGAKDRPRFPGFKGWRHPEDIGYSTN